MQIVRRVNNLADVISVRSLCRGGEPKPQDPDQLHPLGQRRGSVLVEEELGALDCRYIFSHIVYIQGRVV